MKYLLPLLLAGCMATPGGLLEGDFLAKQTTNTLTVSVHNVMPGNPSNSAFGYPVNVQAPCHQVLQPPGFPIAGGQIKSMSGTPGCYPFNVIIDGPFYQYVCTLTVNAPGAYSIAPGPLAECVIAKQSQNAVTVQYAQAGLSPADTPGGPASKR